MNPAYPQGISRPTFRSGRVLLRRGGRILPRSFVAGVLVALAAGRWLTTPIVLESTVDLRLEAGTVVAFADVTLTVTTPPLVNLTDCSGTTFPRS